jgi:hypothetical protein
MDRRVPPLTCLLAIAWLHCSAMAQNALDAALQVGSGGKNTAAYQEDLRSRNLVVTGDVAGGRGFRGSVGYTAESDFRGATGGDTSQRFRSDSAMSNPAVLRTMSANQAFDMASTGGQVAYRRDFSDTTRSGQSGSNALSREDGRRILDLTGTQLTIKSQRDADARSTPMVRYENGEGQGGVLTASTLRGVRRESDRDRQMQGVDRLSLYEAARLRDDLRNGLMRMDAVRPVDQNPFRVAAPTDSVNTSSTRDARQPTKGDIAALPADGRQSAYDQIVREIRTNWLAKERGLAADTETGAEADAAAKKEKQDQQDQAKADEDQLSSAYDQLKKQLRGERPMTDANKDQIAKDAKDAKDAKGDTKPEDGKQPTDDAKNTDRRGSINMSIEDYALVLKHGKRLDAFGDGNRGRLDELLSEGQRAMNEGNSFAAEKRFEIALTMRPGDPRATAGMLHCQIGANLPGSAALTLRALLTNNPEMMDVTYSAQAMPPQSRVEKAIGSTRDLIRVGRDTADYGLLLAYMGHLLGDRAVIEEGLASLKGSPADDTMNGILRKLWLGGEVKSGIEGASPVGTATPAAPSSGTP